MCGIAGLVCLRDACREEEHVARVGAMCDRQAHRGPDDTGVAPLGDVCLGNNRLSIIDLTAAGHMPMATDDGRWWVTYNGEVYNFSALRDELVRRGHAFRSRSDTEVVLRAFTAWGEDCLERFVGMFAVAIYDRRARTLTLARDRFGKKPLYYTTRDGHFLFASEMKALLHGAGRVRVNEQRLAEWALYRTSDVGSAETFVAGVRALPAGHAMHVVDRVVGPPRRYYAPETRVDPALHARLRRAPAAEVVDEVERLVVGAVHDRLVSDVPLGTLCSGGLDSSLVTAVSAGELPRITAFNVGVEGYDALDESRHARACAEAVGADLRVYPLTADAYRRGIVRAVYHSDVPLTHPNSVAFLLVCEFARAHGVKILLSGEGADELFGGYSSRYRRQRHLGAARRLLGRAPRRLRNALMLVGGVVAGVPITRINDYETQLPHAVGFLDRYAREGLHLRGADAYRFVRDDAERSVLAAMLADLAIFLPPLLRRLDRMSMAASVECRVPFLDHRLADLAVNLPLDLRLRGRADKWLLKQVALRRGVPSSIVFRRKVGFPLPLTDYLAPLAAPGFFRDGFCEADLGLDVDALRAAVTGWRGNPHAFFSLLTLEIWGRLFVRDEPVAAVTERLVPARVVPGALAAQNGARPAPGGHRPAPAILGDRDG
jgi:asparagine synthase (glutamine-hydrolysing)